MSYSASAELDECREPAVGIAGQSETYMFRILISFSSWEYARRKVKAANQANYRQEVPGVQIK